MHYKTNLPTFYLIIIYCLIFSSLLQAQDIKGFVVVDDSGQVATDRKLAASFVLLKQFPPGIFQRLDYKMDGPLQKLQTYTDSSLSVLDGKYLEYNAAGYVSVKGQYTNNAKNGDWYYLNEKGKIEKTERYNDGLLENPDVKDTIDRVWNNYGDEREASFGKRPKDWQTFLQKNLDPNAAAQSARGGLVIVLFVVNKSGAVTDLYLNKSVEFVLDEAALKTIRQSPAWTPAFQNGRAVNAYRVQPLTFVK